MEHDQSLIGLFLEQLEKAGQRPNTLNIRRRQLGRLYKDLGPICDWSRGRIERFFDRRNIKPSTRRTYLDSISAFFGWAIPRGFFVEDPSVGIPRSQEFTKAEAVTDAELQALLDATSTQQHFRDLRLWIALSAFQGLQAQQIAALKREELDLHAKYPTLRLDDQRGSARRTNILHPKVLECLNAFGLPKSGRLFPKASGTSVSQRINRRMDAIGSSRQLTGLRYWHAEKVESRGRDFDRPNPDSDHRAATSATEEDLYLQKQAVAHHHGADDEVRHAIELFCDREPTRETRRSAVAALARVLEARRALIKKEFLKKDESDLFHIANGFDIRHNKADQRADYNDAYLDWLFRWYLATIELLDRLLDRQEA